ncbi:VOC family protein [Lysobacter xinjiangensis]|uniref:VOC family protein n=2 Tax=Cognatilysobacter xinjiangensis TaxID=546892 RepID=A0ABQ3BP35_9GAMM|nr:VOC family protein [Lysobacter xinjiangensis]
MTREETDMQLVPYLAFDGDCREAFDFYRDAFDGEIVFTMTVGESPMAAQMPPESHARLMHIELRASGASLMGADMQPGCGDGGGHHGGCVSIGLDTIEEAERVWARLSQGATIGMPLEPTFWATRFGMLTDRFGKAWMINGPQLEGAQA